MPNPSSDIRGWIVTAADGFEALFLQHLRAVDYAARTHGVVEPLIRGNMEACYAVAEIRHRAQKYAEATGAEATPYHIGLLEGAVQDLHNQLYVLQNRMVRPSAGLHLAELPLGTSSLLATIEYELTDGESSIASVWLAGVEVPLDVFSVEQVAEWNGCLDLLALEERNPHD